MHTSERVDVYLSATAQPAIEKCTGIYFSEYPAIPPVGVDEPKNVSHQIPREIRACVVHRELNGRTTTTGIPSRGLFSHPADTVAKLDFTERENCHI